MFSSGTGSGGLSASGTGGGDGSVSGTGSGGLSASSTGGGDSLLVAGAGGRDSTFICAAAMQVIVREFNVQEVLLLVQEVGVVLLVIKLFLLMEQVVRQHHWQSC